MRIDHNKNKKIVSLYILKSFFGLTREISEMATKILKSTFCAKLRDEVSVVNVINEEAFSAGRPCSFGHLPVFSHHDVFLWRPRLPRQLSGAVKLPGGFGDAGSGNSISNQ